MTVRNWAVENVKWIVETLRAVERLEWAAWPNYQDRLVKPTCHTVAAGPSK